MNKIDFIRDTVLENYLGISTRTPCTQQRPQVRCNPASPRGRAGREGRQGPQRGLPPSRGRAQGTGGTGGTEGSWGPGAALRVADRPGPYRPCAPASSRLNPAPRRALLAANAAPTAPGPPRGRLRLPRPLPGPASTAGLAQAEGPSGPRHCPTPASPPRSLAAPHAACRPLKAQLSECERRGGTAGTWVHTHALHVFGVSDHTAQPQEHRAIEPHPPLSTQSWSFRAAVHRVRSLHRWVLQHLAQGCRRSLCSVSQKYPGNLLPFHAPRCPRTLTAPLPSLVLTSPGACSSLLSAALLTRAGAPLPSLLIRLRRGN